MPSVRAALKAATVPVVVIAFVVALSASAGAIVLTPGGPDVTAAPEEWRCNKAGFSPSSALPFWTDERLETDFRNMAATCGRWVRLDILWNVVQARGPSSFDWTDSDRLIAFAKRHGLKVIGMIHGTPWWARPPDTTYRWGPDPQQFAAFAKLAAQRYYPAVRTWEVWNEPDLQEHWTPMPDPRAFADLMKAAYPALKSVDPYNTVLAGSISPNERGVNELGNYSYGPLEFLTDFYAAGARPYFDALGVHPYAWPALYSQGGAPLVRRIRTLMTENGDQAKKLWGTEFGVPTAGRHPQPPVSESTQASMVLDAYRKWFNTPGTGPLLWFSYRDTGPMSSTRYGDHLGIIRNDGTYKPALYAYRRAMYGMTT